MFHQDFEAQYTVTTEYIERTFERIRKEADIYWVCLPMATRTALSSYEMYWYPWDDTKKESWVRPMPDKEYVINLDNNPITTYRYRMHQEDLAKQFGRWYREIQGEGKTVCLLGMRAEESLQRYSGFLNKRYGYKGECWISKQFKDVWCASPLYDWSQSDVWHANYLFDYDYNHLYDLYYMAGLKVSQMRVASPFNDYSKDSLNLYRVIDPEIWVKLVGRVRGLILPVFTGRPGPWDTAMSPFPRDTPGNPTHGFCWTHCPSGCGTIMSRSLTAPLYSGTRQGADWTRRPYGSCRNMVTPFGATACPTTL